MKKLISFVTVLALMVSFAFVQAHAKVFNECHSCGGTGKYVCDNPDCGGKGTFPCNTAPDPDHEKCVNGYVTEKCPDCGGVGNKGTCGNCGGSGKCGPCGGDGKQGELNDRNCGQCGGSGKCVSCSGTGKQPCNTCKGKKTVTEKCRFCNGTGILNCTNSFCVWARSHDGKCKTCKGTGFEGDGVEGTPNDGIHNVPKKGDGVYRLDGSYYVYGGSSSQSSNKPTSSGSNSNKPTSSGSNSNKPASSGSAESATASQQTVSYGRTDVNYSPVKLPSDRQSVMYLGTVSIDNDDFAGTTATGVVDYGSMSPDSRAVFDSIPDDDLAQILGDVQGIISTVQVGQTGSDAQRSVDAFLEANSIKSFDDANILPVSFEGHIDIGFPVRVSVEVEPDRFDGSNPIHVFHIAADGSVTQIPDESVRWITKESGEITRVEYLTDSFSDFLLTDKDGLTAPEVMPVANDGKAVVTPGADTKSPDYTPIIVTVVLVAVVIAGAAVFVTVKSKKKTGSAK